MLQITVVLCALFASLVGADHRLVFFTDQSLVTARLDPAVTPGKVSAHSHHILGGQNFAATYDPDALRASKCSNLQLQADKSNYWFPQIYRILNNGSYAGMQTAARVYYEFPSWLKPGAKIEPFPYDFQMVWGDPTKMNTDKNSLFWISNNFVCDQGNGKFFGSPTLPKVPCQTLIMKFFMPCCWNGKKIDHSNPTAHMSYPIEYFDGPTCPASHPRRFPSILIESFFRGGDGPGQAASGKNQYIMSNGDLTGRSLHADFQNGWDEQVFNDILKHCKEPSVTEPVEKGCPLLAPHIDYNARMNCQWSGNRPAESVGWANGTAQAIRKLPGCNPEWSSGPKPTCAPVRMKGRVPLTVKWIRSLASGRLQYP